MKAVNSPWHDPLSSELCCSPALYTPKAFCSPQARQLQRFLQRRPLGSHLAARGYLSQALIFSVDLSWLLPYPQVFFWGHTKNQRLGKPPVHFPYKNSCFVLELPLIGVGWGALGTSGGTCGARCQWPGQVGRCVQPVPISPGTSDVALSCQPRCPSVLTPAMRMRHKGSSFLPALNCNKGSLSYPSSRPAVPLLLSV